MGTTSAKKVRSDQYYIADNARHGFGTFNGVKLAKDGKPKPHPNDKEQIARFPERIIGSKK